MLISQLAERTGVAASTLRYYDERGILPARRTRSGYRVYDAADLERLRLIITAKRLGLPLEEIARLRDVWWSGACTQVKSSLRTSLAARLAAARSQAVELAAFADSLRGALVRLDALPDDPGPCGAACELIDVTDHSAPPGPAGPRRADSDPSGSDSSAGCSLESADAVAERIGRWRAALADARREEVEGGLRAELPAERAGQVADLAAAEQRCCAFFSFALHFAHDSVVLEVRAPSEGRPMLDTVFGPADAGEPADRGDRSSPASDWSSPRPAVGLSPLIL
ncbi:MerR family transcriptional regulator [Streptomonospora wellingtoniae]|uniref:MerR family transcriptional regulator n=1 Tax=Streptomonospora wellingtoniae TaxID=3075544 RepID=A0ABU2KXT6_9ACTN|nr:MerR family transcriptional regulator [Streptomonospora sp. DSM 45055]MDT0304109.1 MerR family transcriptional regulator [Streptomonospora sp. DSM 45055]